MDRHRACASCALLAVAMTLALIWSHQAPCAEHAGLPASFTEAGADRLYARVVVPDPQRRVGEVRLLGRGSAVVVQTLLSTKVPARVVAEIRKKEEANWPRDSVAGRQSEQYLQALEKALRVLQSRQVGVPWEQRRLRLLIEFVADDSAAGVLVGGWAGERADGTLQPAERDVLEELPLERDYVLRDMRMILIDSFHVADDGLERLGELGPLRAVGALPPKSADSPRPQQPAAGSPAGADEQPGSPAGAGGGRGALR